MKNADIETFNIMAIDPGTNMLGVSIYTLNAKNLDVMNIQTESISLNKFNSDSNRLHDNVLLRLSELDKDITIMLKEYEPLTVAIESGFINKLRPAAFGPLSKALATLELAIHRHSRFIYTAMYPPSVIKVAVGASFKADKDEVQNKIQNIPEIGKFINLKYLTEHEADAVAIGYTHRNYLIRNPALLCLI